MNTNKQILHNTWNRSADIITKKNVKDPQVEPDGLLAKFFSAGPHYYYVIDFFDRQIKYMNPAIEKMLGIKPDLAKLDDIIARIHPDDIRYVAQAEATVLNYLYTNIGRSRVTDYKMSYCFRLRTAADSYRLFQHQAIILTTDEQGGFAKALNIHTDIEHLTSKNNYKATLSPLKAEQEYIHIDVLANNELTTLPLLFSKRETEVIRLIVQGHKSQQIADLLSISLHTVKNHRKNILQKAGVKSTGELVARCINEGLI